MFLYGKDLEDFRKWQKEKIGREIMEQERREREREKLLELRTVMVFLTHQIKTELHLEQRKIAVNILFKALQYIIQNFKKKLSVFSELKEALDVLDEVSEFNSVDFPSTGRALLKTEPKGILKGEEKPDSSKEYTTFEEDNRQAFIRMTRHIEGRLETPKECLIRCVGVLLTEIQQKDWVSDGNSDFAVGFDVKLCGCKVKKDV